MAAAGALAWARRLALALPLPGAYLARLGVPDSNFCVNATYEHRLDNPATYNFCRWGAVRGPSAILACR